MAGWHFIQSPGPTNIPSPVLAALARPPIDFAAPEFMALSDGCVADLRTIVGLPAGTGELLLYAGLGHGAWEATLVNLFEVGDRVLVPEAGFFAARWGRMATDLGLEVAVLPGDWRRAAPIDDVLAALEDDHHHDIAGVLITHTETATGVTLDLAAAAAAIAATGHPAMVVVDAVASLATAPLTMADGGIDVVVASSQKGLMLTPGLSLTAMSDRALERSHHVTRPRAYWSWPARHAGVGYERFCGTPPIQQIFGLRAGLDLLADEGLDAVLARHHRLAGAVRAAVQHWSGAGALELNATEPTERADSVTCIRVADGVDVNRLRAELLDHWNVAIGRGLGQLEGRAFRIGHLGWLNEPMILGVLGAVEAALARCDIAHTPGGTTAAISHLVEAADGSR